MLKENIFGIPPEASEDEYILTGPIWEKFDLDQLKVAAKFASQPGARMAGFNEFNGKKYETRVACGEDEITIYTDICLNFMVSSVEGREKEMDMFREGVRKLIEDIETAKAQGK